MEDDRGNDDKVKLNKRKRGYRIGKRRLAWKAQAGEVWMAGTVDHDTAGASRHAKLVWGLPGDIIWFEEGVKSQFRLSPLVRFACTWVASPLVV